VHSWVGTPGKKLDNNNFFLIVLENKIKYSIGITLIELMIVVTVISILSALAYPSYQAQMQENRRSDGQKLLLEIMNEQQKFFSNNGRYTDDLVSGGDVGLDYDAFDGNGAVLSDNDFYLATAQACPGSTIEDCVLITASPQPGQDDDGPLTYNSRNQKMPIEKW